MALHGAFGPDWRLPPAALAYWQLRGGFEPGADKPLFKGEAEAVAAGVQTAEAQFLALIDRYDDAACAYLAQPNPARAPRYPQYAQLARVAEWSAGEPE